MKKGIPVYDINTFGAYKNEAIIVSRFGHYAKKYQHFHSAHRHSFYHMVYFTKGSGTQTIDFKQYPVLPGLIYFMTPGQVHSWSFTDEVDGYLINFSEAHFNSFLFDPLYLHNFIFFAELSSGAICVLPEDSWGKINELFEDILKEGENTDLYSEDMVRILMLKIFIQVARVLNLKHPVHQLSYNQTLLYSFKKLIETHFIAYRFPKQYAELLHITPNHLNAATNNHLGISAGQLIRNRVILEAKRLLINMELSVAAISDKLAFNDQSYFVKFFKKNVGVTPDKFRKQNR
ncbi:AraC family transcriptional activator of pobA [Pedobacter sp. CG_S7]|uniref:helix-turn-helix domain-containing protein n=1 Tax=Pedobacter sp. CG_S7 TaxID=3143930 RepID=UPI00339A6FBB